MQGHTVLTLCRAVWSSVAGGHPVRPSRSDLIRADHARIDDQQTLAYVYPRRVADGRWEWDEALYAGSAAHYVRGRLPYPAEVASALNDALALNGSGRLLDVGCGPGSFTLVIAPLFDEVVGIDADSAMIVAAAEAAGEAGVANVVWKLLRAEYLPADLGRFRVVTFAQSFRWVDRNRVAAVVRGHARPRWSTRSRAGHDAPGR
jgi:SAM-dependent methyltransferase